MPGRRDSGVAAPGSAWSSRHVAPRSSCDVSCESSPPRSVVILGGVVTSATTPQSPAVGGREAVSAGPVAPTAAAVCRLRPVPLGAVTITGGLWAARREVNGEVAVPFGRERLASAGNLDNLRIAAGAMSRGPPRPPFIGSGGFKWAPGAPRGGGPPPPRGGA